MSAIVFRCVGWWWCLVNKTSSLFVCLPIYLSPRIHMQLFISIIIVQKRCIILNVYFSPVCFYMHSMMSLQFPCGGEGGCLLLTPLFHNDLFLSVLYVSPFCFTFACVLFIFGNGVICPPSPLPTHFSPSSSSLCELR